MDFSYLNTIRQQLPTLLEVMSNQIGDELFKLMQKQFKSETTPTQLAVRTGELLRSFKVGDADNVFEVQKNGSSVNITYGSKLPYASIHEYGGVIKSKGRMHKFFWAMYYSSKQLKYKYMALSVKKRGYIEIPKRPYISKVMEEFHRTKLPTILQNNLNKIF